MPFKTHPVLTKAAKMVAGVLKDLGIDASRNEIDASEGGAAWQITSGSADVMIALNTTGSGAGRLRIVSPIVRFEGELPEGLAARLLDLNGAELPGVAFGTLSGNVVALVTERSVTSLDRSELEEMLGAVGFFADKYDDLLVKEFGGTRVCDLD